MKHRAFVSPRRFIPFALAAALLGAQGFGVQKAAAQPGSGDPVLFWNDQVNRAIQVSSTDPFSASRDLALESVAVLDAIRSVEGGPSLLVHLAAPKDAKSAIAAAGAAHAMLSRLF